MKSLKILILILAFGLNACASTSNVEKAASEAASEPVSRISPEAFLGDKEADALVLDVRTPDEFQEGHLVDALNFDVRAADFKDRILELDRGKTYYLYCRTGNRSGQAGEIMRELGFTSIYNIGGLAELEQAGASVERN